MKVSLKNILWTTLFTCFFSSCVDPYEFPVEEKENNLVVEGFVTTKPGPHLVKLTSTRSIYNKNNQYKLFVEGAAVAVIDEDGNVSQFKEQKPGHYYSDTSFMAKVGKMYKLRIEGFGGKVYESTPEPVLSAAEMHSIRLNYVEKKSVSDNGFIREQGGFNISALVNDNPLLRNQYLLRVNFTYIIYTDPSPKSCCSICWIGERSPDFAVFKDQLVNGQTNAEMFVAFFPVMPKYFASRVYFEVEQLSLTPAAYTFWKSFYDVKNLQGGLFDPAPGALPGNISNLNNKDEFVVGYFFASDVTTKSRFINRSDIPRQIYPPFYNVDCREFANSSAVQPPFWN